MVPPKIPYGGFSPVRLQAWLASWGFPLRRPRVMPPVLHPPFAPAVAFRYSSISVEDGCLAEHRHSRDLRPSAPGALAPVRVILSRSILTYSAPSAPLAGTSRLHRSAAYTGCLRCAGRPRRPSSGSVPSLSVL